jgi:hypothetical protein
MRKGFWEGCLGTLTAIGLLLGIGAITDRFHCGWFQDRLIVCRIGTPLQMPLVPR